MESIVSTSANYQKVRSTKGEDPPRIADQLVCVSSAITAASSCCGQNSVFTLTNSVCNTLKTHVNQDVCELLASMLILETSHLDSCKLTYEKVLQILQFETSSTYDLDSLADTLQHKNFDARRLLHELIVRESNKHLGLVELEIKKLLRRLPEGTQPGDLRTYGWLGLYAAIKQFDPGLGFAFATYACPKINGKLRDGIRDEHPLTKRLLTLSRKVDSATTTLSIELTRTPTYHEISSWLDLKAREKELLPRLKLSASLDELNSGENPIQLPDDCSPEEETESSLLREDLYEAIAKLDDLSQHIIADIFLRGSTLKAAAVNANLDLRTARTVRDDALVTLRHYLGDWSTASLNNFTIAELTP